MRYERSQNEYQRNEWKLSHLQNEGSVDDIEAVLADAEAIVEDAEPDAVRAVEESERNAGKRGWWRFGRRRPNEGDDFRLSDR